MSKPIEHGGRPMTLHEIADAESDVSETVTTLKCPLQYESTEGEWEDCDVPDHCAQCGGMKAEHIASTPPTGDSVRVPRSEISRERAAAGIQPGFMKDRPQA